MNKEKKMLKVNDCHDEMKSKAIDYVLLIIKEERKQFKMSFQDDNKQYDEMLREKSKHMLHGLVNKQSEMQFRAMRESLRFMGSYF